MASTRTLQDTVAWAAPLLRYSPQETGGFEPMLTSANMVKQMILSAPFSWRWNRAAVSFTTIADQQDYYVYAPYLAYMEKIAFVDQFGATFESAQLSVLGGSAETNRPDNVSVQADDNIGNLTFRCTPVPDQVYTVNVVYQQKAIQMSSLASTWYPIPDEMMYLVNLGYITFLSMFMDDARFQIFSQRFIAHLLSAQDAISDISRNLFLANWTQVQSQAQRIQQTTAQGVQARAV